MMAHSPARRPGLRERALVQTLELVDWFALCVLPRGRLRKRLLSLVDRGFATMHRKACDDGSQRL
jgi:hypothetical protein